MSRSSNVEIQNAENLDFYMFWKQYLDRYMKDHYKKHLVYGMRLTNQFEKAMLQLMKLFEYEGQGHQM